MGRELIQLLFSVPAILICMTVHEMSHGYAAYAQGDRTAKQMNRLSLNPLHHIDPIGFLSMLIFRFGWAKPVPVNMYQFRHPKRGMALTALAGPASNVLLAFISLFLYTWLTKLFGYGLNEYVQHFLVLLVWYNAMFAMFNLLPIPPLDGSKILFAFLPDRWYYHLMQYEQYGMAILFALIFLNRYIPGGSFAFLTNGVENLIGYLEMAVRAILFW